MSGKKKWGVLTIVLSSAALLLCLFIWRERSFTVLDITVDGQTVSNVRLIEQRLPFGVEKVMQGAEYTVFDIDWQDDGKGEGKYLFLPGSIDLSKVYARVSYAGDVEEGVGFDMIPLKKDEICYVGEVKLGNHTISVGEESLRLGIMRGSKLPVLWIDTAESMDFIHESRDNTTTGTLRVISAEGDVESINQVETLKGRGNSSWSMVKKSYGIKLEENISLLGMTPGKTWVLSGGGGDVTGIRNKLFLDMALGCGLQNAIEAQWADLYINGSYYGCYLLAEKITVADGRLEIGDLEKNTELLNEESIDKYPYCTIEENGLQYSGYSVPAQPEDWSGGYLLEMEKYESRYVEAPSRFSTNTQTLVIQNPTHATLEQAQYIAHFVRGFEEALCAVSGYNAAGNYYLDYIDLDSFVTRYIIDEISKNIDAGYSSYFLYKPQGDDRLYAGPVWDYDTALGNNLGWGDEKVLKEPTGMFMNTSNWSAKLWQKLEFQERVREIFQESFIPYLERLMAFGLEDYIQTIQESVAMEQICCGRENLEEENQYLREFLKARVDFLMDELG